MMLPYAVTVKLIVTIFANIHEIVVVETDLRIIYILFREVDFVMYYIALFLFAFFTYAAIQADP